MIGSQYEDEAMDNPAGIMKRFFQCYPVQSVVGKLIFVCLHVIELLEY